MLGALVDPQPTAVIAAKVMTIAERLRMV